MSIERIKGKVVFLCDECEDDYDSDTSNFEDALAYAKGDGWIVRKLGGDWKHFCPDCKGGLE